MKGASKVIMGATLVMMVSLAIVLGLILVLLAELYCSLLLRRRKMRKSTSNTNLPTTVAAVTTATNASSPTHETQERSTSTSPLSSLYAHGVLRAATSLLFPMVELESTILEVHAQESNPCHKTNEILSPLSPPSTSSVASPNHVREISVKIVTSGSTACNDKTCDVGGRGERGLLYISNPIYDNDAGRATTPFETPDTFPSRLEDDRSDDHDDENKIAPLSSDCLRLPPLTPMKKLPAQACSVSLRDAIGTSSYDSNSNNCLSSSSSDSPCTSPSW